MTNYEFLDDIEESLGFLEKEALGQTEANAEKLMRWRSERIAELKAILDRLVNYYSEVFNDFD